jgi:hypothetical protein
VTDTVILMDEEKEFFAPAPTDLIDNLLAQYEDMRARVERVADVMNGPDLAGALNYFAEYAGKRDRHLSSSTVETMFKLEGAIAHLNASFWSKAMQLTDVLDVMPQARRDEWHAQIQNPLGEKKDRYSNEWKVQPIPEFNDENVRGTLMSLLAQRDTFFAERVDGIFRSLSKTHVTNAPEGFNRRMILSNVTDSWGTYTTSRAGTINDLRCVIAKFMGREEPSWNATGGLVTYARRRRGEWISVDGGAMRLRCYAVGTAHLEVHPDMAWRLNCVLAKLYPQAIPSQFRERPKKRSKEHQLIGRPLPFAVLTVLASLEEARDLNPNRNDYFRENTFTKVPGCYEFRYGGTRSEQVIAEACQVLQALGGALVESRLGNRFAFDYDPREVVQEIVASGCIPDAKSHQFYPTPAALAERVIELAEIGPEHTCLEPSAGMGGLADLMPKDRTLCVEISALHCKALEAKGYQATRADFLDMHPAVQFSRVVMNPPFSDGRWQAHLQHAADMVAPGGRLVAILPSTAKRSTALSGFSLEWVGPLERQFPGVSVDVVILVANRGAA